MIELKYGKQTLKLSTDCLPLEPRLLSGEDAPAVADGAAAVGRALENPIGSPRLGELVSASDRVVVIVPDLTRAARCDVVLPVLLEELRAAGVSDRAVTILFALGMHSPNSQAEKQQIVGMGVARRVRMVDHDARDPRQNVVVGKTSFGNEIAINRLAVESDKVIVTGTIGFHLFAGFGGGRKGILPGVAGAECTLCNHMLTLTTLGSRWNDAARAGNLEGNPVHLDMAEAADMVKPTFLVNTLVNCEKQIVDVVAGDVHKAFAEGCRLYDGYYRLKTDGKADFVIASCGGYPKDINFIQTHKTIEYAMNVLREGGVMLVLGACSRGLGNKDFLDWFQYGTEEEFAEGLKATYLKGNRNAQTAYRLFWKTRRATIVLFTQLPDSTVQRMGMVPVDKIEDAVTIAREKLGDGFSTHLIPSGAHFLVEAE